MSVIYVLMRYQAACNVIMQLNVLCVLLVKPMIQCSTNAFVEPQNTNSLEPKTAFFVRLSIPNALHVIRLLLPFLNVLLVLLTYIISVILTLVLSAQLEWQDASTAQARRTA